MKPGEKVGQIVPGPKFRRPAAHGRIARAAARQIPSGLRPDCLLIAAGRFSSPPGYPCHRPRCESSFADPWLNGYRFASGIVHAQLTRPIFEHDPPMPKLWKTAEKELNYRSSTRELGSMRRCRSYMSNSTSSSSSFIWPRAHFIPHLPRPKMIGLSSFAAGIG